MAPVRADSWYCALAQSASTFSCSHAADHITIYPWGTGPETRSKCCTGLLDRCCRGARTAKTTAFTSWLVTYMRVSYQVDVCRYIPFLPASGMDPVSAVSPTYAEQTQCTLSTAPWISRFTYQSVGVVWPSFFWGFIIAPTGGGDSPEMRKLRKIEDRFTALNPDTHARTFRPSHKWQPGLLYITSCGPAAGWLLAAAARQLPRTC